MPDERYVKTDERYLGEACPCARVGVRVSFIPMEIGLGFAVSRPLPRRVGGENLVPNGGFDTADGWVIGPAAEPWVIAGGVATCPSEEGSLSRTVGPLPPGDYLISFTADNPGGTSITAFVTDAGFQNEYLVAYQSTNNGAVSNPFTVPPEYSPLVEVHFFGAEGADFSIDNISIVAV